MLFFFAQNVASILTTYIFITRINKYSIFSQDNHVETPGELPNKTKLFFAHAADNWDADYYAKVNDDVYVNVGTPIEQLRANTTTDFSLFK